MGDTLPPAPPFHRGLAGVLHGGLGVWIRRRYRASALLAEAETLHRTLNKRLTAGHTDPLADADPLASIGATLAQATGLVPYPVQLAGALALLRGGLLEMATGEGKTVCLALAGAYLARAGRPVHILTANDYLAERDRAWMQPFYTQCGLTVAAVTGDHGPPQRQQAYQANVVYTTSRELVADYLRDRIVNPTSAEAQAIRGAVSGRRTESATVLRGIYHVLLDEADSVLCDDAVTPLVISRETEDRRWAEWCELVYPLLTGLQSERDYWSDETQRQIHVPDGTVERVRRQLPEDAPRALQANHRLRDLIALGLKARDGYHPGQHYVVQDGQVVIVDEGIGRLMPERRWGEGLQQMIQCKEGVERTGQSETLAAISFQEFFRRVPYLAGCTGTAWEIRGEVWAMYRLPVLRLPPHRPSRRRHLPQRTFGSVAAKRKALLAEISEAQAQGQPLLIGCRTVRESEALHTLLDEAGIDHTLLNAVRNAEEATLIEQAGWLGRVTVATNMAGRGTDIRPTQAALSAGGLRVLATEPHTNRRIDRQLYGRAARQGEPGAVRQYSAADDELLRRHLPSALRWLPLPWRIAIAQSLAESQARRTRYRLLEVEERIRSDLGQ